MAFRSTVPRLAKNAALDAVLKKSPSDVVFTTALRTPIARMNKGFKHAYPEELLAHVYQRTRERLEARGVDISIIEDICAGTVLAELGGAKSGRLAALHAGMPITSAYRTTNRQCASSVQSITDIGSAIQTGAIRVGIAAGFESMSKDWETKAIPVKLSPAMAKSPNQDARDCLMSMGMTSENVAERFGVGRQRQDAFAAQSHARAHAAQEDGRLAQEIEPIEVRWVEEDGTETTRLISKDEGIRHGTTAEKLSQLKPVFKPDGCSTAGNSSQVSDGAVALTMARRDVAEAAGMEILGKWVATSTMGVKPDEMGIGPARSTPKLLTRLGLDVKDIDLWEINEAFASQALMTLDALKISEENVNVKGGAIALGHPLGASGGRLTTSLLSELRRTGKQTGVVSLCCGTGYGVSALIVAE
ncbi:putative acetyl-CoA C-acyltransferase precursor [Microstroma glucosiphilum]|uniref:acetyl-CoA C-acyltransferase n=1 Tax=Pseudomicrostroma glucosiphilum TaxID=1684307 RepID=A0A316U8Y8_9BASI|nr:putative acetyl-CoA C-acyltransferase precursor [Pseudomicrostroma glucosiphilum]PWN21298.1 putative acetyl-CoA C-acyltransferase precursor [Pseudomicrostroma glucosiphilum]